MSDLVEIPDYRFSLKRGSSVILYLSGLKTVISELPPSSTALAASICKKITGRLTSAISKVRKDCGTSCPRGARWLMPQTPDPEVGGSSPTRVKPCCVIEQGAFTPQKVLVIPRKRWLRPNMTEKLFTGMLRINQPNSCPPNRNRKLRCNLPVFSSRDLIIG